MATRRVTQETFDAAVRENMEEFEMEAEAALREAVEQFESQGVNLNFIVKAVPSDEKQDEPTHEVLQALESLRIGKDTGDFQDVMADINLFTENCQSGFAQRYLAAQKDAYPIILSFCKKSLAKPEAALASLSALAALTDGQPDLLDSEGQQFLLEALRKFQTDPTATCEAVRAVRLCCVKHEQNRQDLIKGGVLPLLTGAMTVHRECAELVKETSAALRVMTFDDDVRVTFGHAHEHAKMIVLEQNGLKVLIETAQAHLNNTSVLSDICATLSCLAVRNEFCQDISDLGGLKLMLTLLAESYETPELVKQVLGAIKAVAGNDDVKDAVVSAGGVQLIVMAMNRHLSNASVCEQGCACLAVLALRKPNNCKAIMENGGALAAIQSMKAHVDAASVQKQACMLLRNLVSRLKNYSRPILELGAEALIAHALQTHRDCGDVGKAALRDLGCKVELQELWTGKHGSLTN